MNNQSNNLRVGVRCFRCYRNVGKNQAREVVCLSKEPRYECFDCFKRNKRDPLLSGIEKPAEKQEYLCGRCKYKFSSKKRVCPYCGNIERIEQVSGVTVYDLI